MATGSGLYRHRQTGVVILVAFGMALVLNVLFIFLLPWEGGDEPGRTVLLVTTVLLVVVTACFGSLTIRVADGRLSWQFGPGPVRKSVPIGEVVEVRATRMSALAGWGIRWTPQGWLYNVSGLDAVEVTLRSGKRFFLGTDEPDRLIAAIQAARPESARS